MKRLILCSAFLGAFYLLSSSAFGAAPWQLKVEAGEFDRQNSIVTFEVPETLKGTFELQASDGSKTALQIDGTKGVFIEANLPKGTSKTYTFVEIPTSPLAIRVEEDGSILKVSTADNKPIFNYQGKASKVPEGVVESFSHGAHLHPLFTPSGKIVTGDYPVDHRWHRGVWIAWTKTEFEGRHPDFWNMAKDGSLTGEVRFKSLDTFWSGAVQGGFISQHRFIDHTGGTERDVLAETWQVTATQLPATFVIDLTSTQSAVGSEPLKLPKYHYGGLGARGAPEWDAENAVTMLTSNGDDRKKGDSTQAKWVHLSGKIGQTSAGFAILIHPHNFRFPQPLRLNPKNPQLSIAPSQEGDWEIAPGKPYISRYRLIVADGDANAETLEKLWNDYATPPRVTLAQP